MMNGNVIWTCFIFLHCWNLQAQKSGSTYRANNLLYGPQVGYGLSTGSRLDYKNVMYKKTPGASATFGFSFYKFVSENQNIGISLNFLQQRWNFSEQESSIALAPDARYSVSEHSVVMPLEFNHYFAPYKQRWFLGFSVDPGFLIQKNLERKRNNDIDSTLAYEYSERGDFSKLNLGGSAKIGVDLDMDFKNTLRFYFLFSARTFFDNPNKKSSSYGFFLVAQYFWSE